MLLFALTEFVGLLIYVLIMLIVISVLWYVINLLAPEPIKRYAFAIVIVLAAIFLIYLLLGLAGGQGVKIP